MIDVKVATVYSLDLPDTENLRVGRRRRYLSKYAAVRAYCAHNLLVRLANREDWDLETWDEARSALQTEIFHGLPWRHYKEHAGLFYRYYRFVLRAMKDVGPSVSLVEWRDPAQELPSNWYFPCLVVMDGRVYTAVWDPGVGGVFYNASGGVIPVKLIDLWARMPKPVRPVDVPDRTRAVLLEEAQEWLQHHGGLDVSRDDGLRTLLAKLNAVLK